MDKIYIIRDLLNNPKLKKSVKNYETSKLTKRALYNKEREANLEAQWKNKADSLNGWFYPNDLINLKETNTGKKEYKTHSFRIRKQYEQINYVESKLISIVYEGKKRSKIVIRIKRDLNSCKKIALEILKQEDYSFLIEFINSDYFKNPNMFELLKSYEKEWKDWLPKFSNDEDLNLFYIKMTSIILALPHLFMLYLEDQNNFKALQNRILKLFSSKEEAFNFIILSSYLQNIGRNSKLPDFSRSLGSKTISLKDLINQKIDLFNSKNTKWRIKED